VKQAPSERDAEIQLRPGPFERDAVPGAFRECGVTISDGSVGQPP
jgi:hypothetical protein